MYMFCTVCILVAEGRCLVMMETKLMSVGGVITPLPAGSLHRDKNIFIPFCWTTVSIEVFFLKSH
jgi:hypothetical protein